VRKAGCVAARAREALHDALLYRINNLHENNGDRGRLRLDSSRGKSGRKDHIRAYCEEFHGHSSGPNGIAPDPAGDQLKVPALDPAEVAQRFAECAEAGLSFRVVLRGYEHYADAPHAIRQLRKNELRPSPSRRGAEAHDELPSPHEHLPRKRTCSRGD